MIGLYGVIKRQRAPARVWTAGRRLSRSESGSALVEMAISSAVILSIFFGVIEFGFALYSAQYVKEIARDLSRYAIVRGSACGFGMPNCGVTQSQLQTYAQQTYTYPGLDPTQLTVTATWYSPVKDSSGFVTSWSACGTACNAPGNLVKVQVTYPFPLSIPFWQATTLNMKGSTSMVIAQ